MRRNDETLNEAHALRRYVVARAASREHATLVKADLNIMPGCIAWVGCTEADADGRDDSRSYRRLRRSGMPWCSYLGADTSIAEDAPLQAYFEHHGVDGHYWNLLRAEVSRNRVEALRTWRRKGQEILLRARAEREGLPVQAAANPLFAILAKPGTGRRSMKRGKRN